jgi:hypothetical protein
MRRASMFTLGWAAALWLGSAALGGYQAPPQVPKMSGSAVLFGTVVADATGRPIRGAAVIAIVTADAATFTKNTTTDRLGRFVLTGLAPGQIRLSASAPGYLGGVVGQSGPDDTLGAFMPIANGQVGEPVTLRLRRGAAIAGLLLDDAGEPLGGVSVQAFRRSFSNGRRVFTSSGSARTDDRGAYRLANLIPGAYIVGVVPRSVEADMGVLERIGQTRGVGNEAVAAMAGVALTAAADASSRVRYAEGAASIVHVTGAGSPIAPPAADGTPRGYAPTFYPGTPASQATSIVVGPAEERGGIVFQLSATPIARIAGRVVGPAGPAPAETAISLVPQPDDNVQTGDTITALVGASGQFALSDVPSGAYRIEARAGFGGAVSAERPRLWASVPVMVGDAAVTDLVVALHEGATLSGDVRFEGRTPAPAGAALASWFVQLSSQAAQLSLSSSSSVSVAIDAAGHFAFPRAIVPGDYRVRVATGLPGAWAFASIAIGGREDADSLVHVSGDNVDTAVITLSDRRTELSGAVTDAIGTPIAMATVVAFPQDTRLRIAGSRWIASARPLTDGHYQIRDLPPGEYFVAVVSSVERGQWVDAEFLTTLQPTAVRVTLATGEKKTLDLRGAPR